LFIKLKWFKENKMYIKKKLNLKVYRMITGCLSLPSLPPYCAYDFIWDFTNENPNKEDMEHISKILNCVFEFKTFSDKHGYANYTMRINFNDIIKRQFVNNFLINRFGNNWTYIELGGEPLMCCYTIFKN
jgi:hypothetical protein